MSSIVHSNVLRSKLCGVCVVFLAKNFYCCAVISGVYRLIFDNIYGNMAENKISFSFKPLNKSSVLKPIKKDDAKKPNDIELIQFLEDRSIKVVE